MADTNIVNICATSLKLTQELRAGVSTLFSKLSNGVDGQKGSSQATEKAFVEEVNRSVNTVNKALSELEKVAGNLTPTGNSDRLGNSSLLVLDPMLEKTPLHAQLLNTYKWTNKIQKYSVDMIQTLQPNLVKRSSSSSILGGKRPRKMTPSTHTMPAQTVDQVIHALGRNWSDMTITVCRPFGSPTVLQLTLGQTMKALIVLRGLIIEYVSAMAISENVEDDNGKIDIWIKSQYLVFQKVTDHMNSAMLHFHTPAMDHMVLKPFLVWLHSYVTLFTAPCEQCGHILQQGMPPTWRDTRNLRPYHETCRP